MKRLHSFVAVAALMLTTPAFAESEGAQEFIAQVPPAAITDGAAKGRRHFSLTDDQLQKLRAVKEKYFADNTMKKAQLKILKHDLRNLLTKPTVDRSAVLSVQGKINALQGELSNARINQIVDASEVFTAEQREAMQKRMLHGGKHHRRGGGGPRDFHHG